LGCEIILLNCSKWPQTDSTVFTPQAFGSAWKKQLANRKEPSAAKPQPKAELTTDRTDATDKGNPSNPRIRG